MSVRPLRVRALGVALALLLVPSVGRGALWVPRGIAPTQTPIATILAAYRASLGRALAPQRVEVYRLNVPGHVPLLAVARIRGMNFRIDTSIDGASYASGRAGPLRWRRTPAGVVRIIESDIQGDDLDRWPHAVLGFDPSACVAGGETHGATPAWVLACHPPEGIAHWYFIDESTGRIRREVTRDGSRVVTYTFSDFRTRNGSTRAYAWRISGTGGDANVRVVSVTPVTVTAQDVAIPESVATTFTLPPGSKTTLPVRFSRDLRMMVPVSVNGRRIPFAIDTGTTQILMDIGAAARHGLHMTLGHTLASEMRIGDAVAHNVPIQTTDIFGGAIRGLLGNEFFLGHIVHLDYRDRTLQFLSRTTFTPPKGAVELPVDYSEGMPIVTARVGDFRGDRFALDTGSYAVLLSHRFAARAASTFARWPRWPVQEDHFLEGIVSVRRLVVSSFTLGPVRFEHQVVQVAQADPGDIALPFDGIIGTNILSQYEWWFDYSGDRLWVRYRPLYI